MQTKVRSRRDPRVHPEGDPTVPCEPRIRPPGARPLAPPQAAASNTCDPAAWDVLSFVWEVFMTVERP